MAVLLNCGAIFLHVPKTGGSWVTEVLQRQGLVRKKFGHIHADYVRALYYAQAASVTLRGMYDWGKSCLPRSLKSFALAQQLKRQAVSRQQRHKPFVFCFVRHPLDWYESWWRYMCQRSGFDWSDETDLHSWHPCLALKHAGHSDFNVFMQRVLDTRPGFVTELFASYVPPDIDFVGKQETLCDDLIRVLQGLNLPFDELAIRESEPTNASSTASMRIRWSQDLHEEALRTEYVGLLRFGYAASQHPQLTLHD